MNPDQLALKRATAETIKGVGGVEAAAGFARVGKSVLSDNQSANHADSYMALDVLADLEPLARERTGWPHVTRLLAQRQGFLLVRVPDAVLTGVDLLALLGAQARESGQLAQAICTSLADGRIDRNDAARIRGELRQLMEIAAEMAAELALIEGETR